MERSVLAAVGEVRRPAAQRDPVGQARGDAAAAQRTPARRRRHRPRVRPGRVAPGAQGALAGPAHRRRVGNPPGAGRACLRDLDRKARPARRHAPNSPAMNLVFDMRHVLVAAASAIVGAGCGWLVRRGSVRLAMLEGLEPAAKPWQGWGPPIAAALVFGAFGFALGATWLLLLHCVFGLVLVQVIFFDLEHRLILDRVIFPAMGLALAVS